MDIDRRKLLAGATGLALIAVVRSPACAEVDFFPAWPRWHPLIDELLCRARQSNFVDGGANTASIERIVRNLATAQGCTKPPVIK